MTRNTQRSDRIKTPTHLTRRLSECRSANWSTPPATQTRHREPRWVFTPLSRVVVMNDASYPRTSISGPRRTAGLIELVNLDEVEAERDDRRSHGAVAAHCARSPIATNSISRGIRQCGAAQLTSTSSRASATIRRGRNRCGARYHHAPTSARRSTISWLRCAGKCGSIDQLVMPNQPGMPSKNFFVFSATLALVTIPGFTSLSAHFKLSSSGERATLLPATSTFLRTALA